MIDSEVPENYMGSDVINIQSHTAVLSVAITSTQVLHHSIITISSSYHHHINIELINSFVWFHTLLFLISLASFYSYHVHKSSIWTAYVSSTILIMSISLIWTVLRTQYTNILCHTNEEIVIYKVEKSKY